MQCTRPGSRPRCNHATALVLQSIGCNMVSHTLSRPSPRTAQRGGANPKRHRQPARLHRGYCWGDASGNAQAPTLKKAENGKPRVKIYRAMAPWRDRTWLFSRRHSNTGWDFPELPLTSVVSVSIRTPWGGGRDGTLRCRLARWRTSGRTTRRGAPRVPEPRTAR